MLFTNSPGVPAAYLDGNLKQVGTTTQPKILVLGTSTSGLSYERYNVTSAGAMEKEFGAATEIAKGVHELLGQGSNNISVMRIGGQKGSFVFTDSNSKTLTIVPEGRDDTILDDFSLVIETVSGENRILIWSIPDEEWVFDSLEILTLNSDILSVVDTGIDLFTTGDKALPRDAIALSALVTGDFTVAGTATASTVVATDGTDGTSMSLPERYAALSQAYFSLDYADADMVSVQNVYVDDQNAADGDSIDYFKGVPPAGTTIDTLGYLWQYVYRGKPYTYFVDRSDYFSATDAAATKTINTDLVLTADKTGTGGNKIYVEVDVGGSAGPTITVSEPAVDKLKILVTDDGSSTTSATVTAINTALGLYTTNTGVLASTLVTASGGGVTTLVTVAETTLLGGTGGHVLTHEDLTGDSIPSAVSTAFAAGSDAQLREVNFGHQLATFLHQASTTWKAMQGSISVKAPTDFSRNGISEWVGVPPEETLFGTDPGIDAVADNGSGLFSIKLMCGLSASGAGYRAAMLDNSTTTDSYLYGGFIATSGASLPNETESYAYGIDDGDELLDENGAPVDIGKHLWVTVDWPVHRNSYNGGTQYRGSIATILLGRLATVPVNEEPIGQDYPLKKITSIPRIHSTQRDLLTKFRFVNLRFEDGVGWVFNTIKTGAHKLDSDYTRGSTIRCSNRLLTGIRNIGKAYVGKDFSPGRLAFLQSEVDKYVAAERTNGIHQGAGARISYTRIGKILGNLDILVEMVPPFTIERITTKLSLAADETDL